MVKNNKTRFFYVLHFDKTWVLDHSEHAQGPSYLTIIPQAGVGYEMVYEARSAELAIIISYPTRASGVIVLLKTPQKWS